MGWAIVARRITASASESQIPGGSLVTATKMPSKPYDGSKITSIFLPIFLSSIWKMESGKPFSVDIITAELPYLFQLKTLTLTPGLTRTWLSAINISCNIKSRFLKREKIE
jgi:hypothetical protein